MTAPRPTVTSLEIMPVYGQSENRAIPDALAGALDAAATDQVYFTFGMRDLNGTAVGPNGAGLAAIDQSHAASGFEAAAGLGRVSPAFALQHLRAARWRDAGQSDRGLVIADHGFGGRLIGEWMTDSASPLGRNQLYWMRESARLAQAQQVPLHCPYALLFQGTSAKDQPGEIYRTEFEAAHGATVAQAQALFGIAPRIVVVVNGADVNTIGDLYATPGVQYRIALEHGGIVATWQRIFPIRDQNIHPSGQTQVLIGETCEWAIAEIEAGNPWNITYDVVKRGTTVAVHFALRPGETLLQRPEIYDPFGGGETCPNLGFEAEGGILSAIPDLAGNVVTLTLADAQAGWLRFAHQVQDCQAMTDANGVTMSAHRSTLFASHSRPSRIVAGETLWRALPGFRGRFSDEVFTPEY
ncbi:hypothetical protein [Paracoccus laeviglucosivorans]|uniref:Sialate O-acetylesterase domain-containing protein n=1 Tax=Paracoccus laeviglucosivorans TaxID=1197861 RepID=A0A521BYM2_9RHOB|nr:hypothetical protein [Paracoccus laeviglucosivorans]SMO52289.1 hypothetical protein SAMN06265221_103266 [Paracoccus laeviglucosivorans]